MRYGILVLALGALWSSQASAGDFPQSVYVAPGGVYIASAHVRVGTESGYPAYGAPGPTYYAPHAPAYAPRYLAPGPAYGAPTYYEGYRSAYPTRRAYIDPSDFTYAEEPPRPPAPVPYDGAAHCVFDQVYGRPAYCD
ncbi:MAG: hypothetical protein JO266_22905 [Acidobacteria bacterium]|nr:hypothetical protein [Acidobacteriota bacterium]